MNTAVKVTNVFFALAASVKTMFLEDQDWNDEEEEQHLSKTVTDIQQATGVTDVKVNALIWTNEVVAYSDFASREREKYKVAENHDKDGTLQR